MQFKEFWMALRRRWYLVLVALMVSAGACYGVVKAVGPTYETTGVVLILPPGASSSDPSSTVGNPFLSLSGVSQARDVVIRTMMSKTFMEELCNSSGDAEHGEMLQELCRPNPTLSFEVTPDYTSSAPMILITVEANSPANGGVALEAVADRVPDILDDLQADLGLRKKALISSTQVVMDYQPDIVRKSQIRAGIVAGVGVLGLGMLVVGLVDGLLMRRRRARLATEEQRGAAPDLDAGLDHTPGVDPVEDREVTEVTAVDGESAEDVGDRAEDPGVTPDAARRTPEAETAVAAAGEFDTTTDGVATTDMSDTASEVKAVDQDQLPVADPYDREHAVINLERTRRRSRTSTESSSSGSG